MSSSNRTNIPNSLNEHWMPFTDNKSFKKNPRLITEAKGVYLTNHEGKKMIDASSGLFCNPLGHGRREITEAVSKQLEKLDYCQPFNQGDGGYIELATRINAARSVSFSCSRFILAPIKFIFSLLWPE